MTSYSARRHSSARAVSSGYPDDPSAQTPALRLQWVKAGDNFNVSGYCESGELFAFLASSPAPREIPLSSKLLRVIAGETKHERKVPVRRKDTTLHSLASISDMTDRLVTTSTTNTSPGNETPANETGAIPPSASAFEKGVLDPDSPGGLFLSGKPFGQDIIDARFSYVESKQAAYLYQSLTVLETLSFSAELRVAQHSQPVELSVLRLLTEMGFKDWAELRVSQLSEWQRRMLLFATEAIMGNDALFFDMPTIDLDAPSALAMVTSLQRAARGGRLVAIALNALTFREYAMLDTIQIISSLGSVYFGPGASAANYFRQLGRTPSPGASITDFLLDLVDDDMWPGGYADAHLTYLEDVAERLSLEQVLLSETENNEGDNTNAGLRFGNSGNNRFSDEDGSNSNRNADIPVRAPRRIKQDFTEESQIIGDGTGSQQSLNYGTVASESRLEMQALETPKSSIKGAIADAGARFGDGAAYVYNNFLSPGALASVAGYGRLADESGTRQESPLEEHVRSPHSLGGVLDSINAWTLNNGEFLEEEADDCWPRMTSSSFARGTLVQFSLCFWRAVVIRRRNLKQIVATWVFTGLQVVIGLGALFCASGFDNSESSLRARVTFLAILPFTLILLANNWNEYSEKDRNVLTYESKRNYYVNPVVSPLAALMADIIAFHLAPPIVTATILYPVVGLTSSWDKFLVYLRTVLTMCVAACCLNKAIAGALAMGTRGDIHEDIRPKCNLVTSFVYCVLFLYSGLLLDVGDDIGPLHMCLRSVSFFYYGCNILFWNEFGGTGKNDANSKVLKSFLESMNVPQEDANFAWLMLFSSIVLLVVTVGATSMARLYKVKVLKN